VTYWPQIQSFPIKHDHLIKVLSIATVRKVDGERTCQAIQ
jgi:hypothetical protein